MTSTALAGVSPSLRSWSAHGGVEDFMRPSPEPCSQPASQRRPRPHATGAVTALRPDKADEALMFRPAVEFGHPLASELRCPVARQHHDPLPGPDGTVMCPDGRERAAPGHHAKVASPGGISGRGCRPEVVSHEGAVEQSTATHLESLPKGSWPGGRRVMAWLSQRHRLRTRPHPVSGTCCWPPRSASREHDQIDLPGRSYSSGSTRGWPAS